MAGLSTEVYDVCQYVCSFGGRLCCCWNGITVNKNELQTLKDGLPRIFENVDGIEWKVVVMLLLTAARMQ